jgi:hypothetical protein
MRADLGQALGEDVYQALRGRGQERRRRLVRRQAVAQAEEERRRCACRGGQKNDCGSTLPVIDG